MTNTRRRLTVTAIIALGLIATGCSQGTAPPSAAADSTQEQSASGTNSTSSTSSAGSSSAAPKIPAYHATLASAQPLPTPRPASRYAEFPIIEKAYIVASEITEVLALQPCYCYCDKSAGHGSLADCWASDHGAG